MNLNRTSGGQRGV